VLGGVVFDGERGLRRPQRRRRAGPRRRRRAARRRRLGDIGEHFPDTDPQWKGVDSLVIVRHVAALLREQGWTIGNVDCAVVCEAPKLAPRKAEMQRNLSDAAGASVTVKGRRAEGLGTLGRREGIACWAVAVIQREEQQ
jgi:2-C-methyl-D-erythritol 2,4-cyclodiphosphate synthase